MQKFFGWLLGLDNVTAIDNVDFSFGAAWAEGGIFWLVLIAVALFVASIVFYLMLQKRGHLGVRIALGAGRGVLFVLLLITLAKPILHTTITSEQSPYVYFIFDGTDSMAIEDELTSEEQSAMANAVGLNDSTEKQPQSRAEYLKAWLARDDDNLVSRISGKRNCRMEAFLFDGNTTSQLRKMDLKKSLQGAIDTQSLSDQISTKGQVSALGSVLNDAAQQNGAGNLAAIVLVSDFAQNSGTAPLGSRRGTQQSPASKLGVPIYTVGIGATEARDLSIDIQTDPKMKRAERTTVLVKLRQSGLQNETVTVSVRARKMSGETQEGFAEIPVGQQTVTLTTSVDTAKFSFVPQEAGRFEFIAEAEPLSGEIDDTNNRATREVNIIDDYLRLMYVSYEPTWEWRFVKEVFHRDKLVGMDGFRTYLASSDPRVRENNVLFMPTLTPRRSEFFKNDVIFLGDMPQTTLSSRFCEMMKEYVGTFGGGLVVIAGPRFGPQQLHGTPLADMLPVIIDPDARIRDSRQFQMRLTGRASNYPFMNLGSNDVENARGWNNLGQLQWYQPVAGLHDLAEVLAEHPQDKCQDGKINQPLIAVRRYGKGEVVYLAFNEMWRLRRKYGETYYRQFWSQLIYRLGMSHALGSEKRFVVRTDRQQYRSEQKVILTVEAYDEDFEPLTGVADSDGALEAEIITPGASGAPGTSRPLAVPELRQGVFEARVPAFAAGEYSIRVKDPITNQYSEVRFDVSNQSAERRTSVRNVRLQEDLAAETNGKSYDLTTVSQLADDLHFEPTIEIEPRNYPLWPTWLWFIPIVGLMLTEWLVRKLINLK